jgi:hypothetical protein
MTDDQLDAIEAALKVRLPADYRHAVREHSTPAGGRDDWRFDDPQSVINSTRYPLETGDYSGPDLLLRYVAVGASGGGDKWLLDLDFDGHPVPFLSHETHAVEPEWPSFAAFLADRRAAPGLKQARLAAEAAERAAWWRRYRTIAGVIAFFGFVIPLLLLRFAS